MADWPVLLGGLRQENGEFTSGLGSNSVEVGFDHGLGSGHLRCHSDLGWGAVRSKKKEEKKI